MVIEYHMDAGIPPSDTRTAALCCTSHIIVFPKSLRGSQAPIDRTSIPRQQQHLANVTRSQLRDYFRGKKQQEKQAENGRNDDNFLIAESNAKLGDDTGRTSMERGFCAFFRGR